MLMLRCYIIVAYVFNYELTESLKFTVLINISGWAIEYPFQL